MNFGSFFYPQSCSLCHTNYNTSNQNAPNNKLCSKCQNKYLIDKEEYYSLENIVPEKDNAREVDEILKAFDTFF